jgi:hypothetical protein
MKKLELKTSLTILAAALLVTACGGNGSSSEGRLGSNDLPASDADNGAGTPPSAPDTVCSGEIAFAVKSFDPVDGASDIDTRRSVQIEFNVDVDPESVNDSSVFLAGGTSSPVEAVLTTTANAIVIDPVGDLQEGTSYTITVEDTVAADCEEDRSLATRETSSFTTGDATNQDNEAPSLVISTPEELNGTPLPVNGSLTIDFSEGIDASTISLDTIFISPDGGLTKIDGVFSFDGSRVTFTPSEPLNGNTSFDLIVLPGIRDLSGNDLPLPPTGREEFSFITSGIIAIIDGLEDAAPGNPLSELLNQLEELSANLQNPGDGSLPNPDELILLEIFPLLVDNEPTPENLADFSSVLIAVCDPKGNAAGDPACTLSLDIAFGSFSEEVQQQFADALTNGDPVALGQAFLSIGELVFSNDGGLVSVELLDDNGLPLPEFLEDPIVDLLNQIGQIPVIGDLTNQGDLTPLLDAKVLKASVATVKAGQLLELVVIPTDVIQNGINGDFSLLEAGGSLIDGLSGNGGDDLFNALCSGGLLCIK